MRKIFVALTIFVFGAVAYAEQQTTVFVSVAAPATGPMADLKAKDFVAKGGGANVTDAVHATEPLSIQLLVDISRPPLGVTPPIDDLRTALKTFVQTVRAGDPAARIGLIQVGGAAVPVVELGASPAALDKALGMVTPGPEMGGAVLIEAVQDASHALANEPAPRRAIVSVDFASADPIPDTAVNNIAKDVFRTGASVWAVCARGNAQQPISRENTLNTIVKNNGGVRITIVESTGLKSQLQAVANSLLSQYELTLAKVDPAHVRDVKLTTSTGAKVLPSVFAR
jgi:hypothetical protein